MNYICNSCHKIVSDLICPYCNNFTTPITGLIEATFIDEISTSKKEEKRDSPEEFKNKLLKKLENSSFDRLDISAAAHLGKLCYECGLGLSSIKI